MSQCWYLFCNCKFISFNYYFFCLLFFWILNLLLVIQIFLSWNSEFTFHNSHIFFIFFTRILSLHLAILTFFSQDSKFTSPNSCFKKKKKRILSLHITIWFPPPPQNSKFTSPNSCFFLRILRLHLSFQLALLLLLHYFFTCNSEFTSHNSSDTWPNRLHMQNSEIKVRIVRWVAIKFFIFLFHGVKKLP